MTKISRSPEPIAFPFPLDPVIEVYKKDIDRTLLRENLKLTPEQRFLNLIALSEFAAEVREAGKRYYAGKK
ncbi:hypothetical protein HYR69_04935 [Candidatus Sumerlaeota bacterium]|nr:hypothetical protein [Candidatus Sumerlaeota bacterium]